MEISVQSHIVVVNGCSVEGVTEDRVVRAAGIALRVLDKFYESLRTALSRLRILWHLPLGLWVTGVALETPSL